MATPHTLGPTSQELNEIQAVLSTYGQYALFLIQLAQKIAFTVYFLLIVRFSVMNLLALIESVVTVYYNSYLYAHNY